jgi:outer membrane lipoprotein-sorting protein
MNMGNLKAVVMTAGVLLMLSMGSPARAAESPRGMLDELAERGERVRTLHQVSKTTTQMEDATRETTTNFWMMRDGDEVKTRVEHAMTQTNKAGGKDAKRTSKSLEVCDGRSLYREMSMRGDAVVLKTPAPENNDGLNEIRQLFDNDQVEVRVRPRETIDGETCIVFVCVLEKGLKTRTTFWVSDRYGFIFQKLVENPNGTKNKTVTTEFEVNERIDADKFEYQVPDNARVIEMPEGSNRFEMPARP